MLIDAPQLALLPRVRHAFFTREGGASRGLYESLNGGLGSADDPAHVAENRRRMATVIGVESAALLSLHQIHSAEAVTVREPWGLEERPRADGMATALPGLALAIATADCGPVLFADGEAGVVGACHAGWKGALGGILEATLARMGELGAVRSRVVAVLGPTIGPESYEVGPDFVTRFDEEAPGCQDLFRVSERHDRALFDLPGFILRRLEAAGIGDASALGLDTYVDEERFFSFRRCTHRGETDYGRLISAVSLMK